jgi:4-amino-4-deoxy-L-arabinose transferase-like glycosyltransferase
MTLEWLDRRRIYLLLAVILVVYTLLVAINPDVRCVQDEPWVSVPAYTLMTEGTLSLNPINADGMPAAWPPLLQLCLAPVYKVFGFGLVQGRSLMMFFGALSIIIAFLFTRDLFDSATALLAAALLSVDNLFFLAARTIRAEILVTTLVLLSGFLCIRGILSDRRLLFFLSGLSGAAAMSTHPHGFIGLASIVLLIPFEYRKLTFRRPGLYYLLAGAAAGSLPFIVYILTIDLRNGFQSLRTQVLTFAPGKGGAKWLLDSIKNEWAVRYQRYLLAPYRVHLGILAVGIVVAAFVLPCRRRRLVAAIVVTHLVFFILLMTAQKNVRYLVLVSPYLAMLVASLSLDVLRRTRHPGEERREDACWVRGVVRPIVAATLLLLWGGTQFMGNITYHVQYRDTGYYKFTRRLKTIIPEGASVFSIITFWFAFYDRPFYSYNRMSFETAIEKYHPRIFLLDDSFMVNGERGDHQWEELRLKLHAYVSTHGALLGTVDNWFYGDIKIFEVTQ